MEDIFESLKTMSFDINEHNPSFRKWGTGFPHTEETKQLLREMKTGLKQTPEHVQKRVNSVVGFKQSQYQKEIKNKYIKREKSNASKIKTTKNIKNLKFL